MMWRQIDVKDWVAEGEALFGKNRDDWKFKCVQCGNVQTAKDFREIGLDPEKYVFFSCIGRWKKGVGCDWTLGGLFKIHKLEVMVDGKPTPAFEFATEEKRE